jgi:small GTP-binding protein
VSNSSAYFRSRVFEVGDREVKINLWDTAGQERYFSLTKMYVQDASCVVLVYDTTYADSLEGVRQWYQLVSEHLDMSRIVIALVGNKCDLQD